MRARQVVALMLVGGTLGLVATFMVLRALNRDPAPPLTPERFHAAHQAWKQVAPASYAIEIRVTGSQPATYRVVVEGGEAQAAWRNGQPLTTRRTFGTWSVPGMFSTISRDIESVERHATGRADQFTPRLTLRAEFDPQYHYPRKYRRIEQWSHVEVAWEVTRFEVSPPGD